MLYKNVIIIIFNFIHLILLFSQPHCFTHHCRPINISISALFSWSCSVVETPVLEEELPHDQPESKTEESRLLVKDV